MLTLSVGSALAGEGLIKTTVHTLLSEAFRADILLCSPQRSRPTRPRSGHRRSRTPPSARCSKGPTMAWTAFGLATTLPKQKKSGQCSRFDLTRGTGHGEAATSVNVEAAWYGTVGSARHTGQSAVGPPPQTRAHWDGGVALGGRASIASLCLNRTETGIALEISKDTYDKRKQACLLTACVAGAGAGAAVLR